MVERHDDTADFWVHYELGLEHERLFPGGTPTLEFARTMELLGRLLPVPPALIADIGGGTGAYASPLARQGYDVSLIDSVELHVDMAREVSSRQPDHLFSARLGDARRLDLPSEYFDAVLLLGPLYHLTDRDDRVTAVREAFRILKPGGVLMAAGISRFRSLIGGLVDGMLQDPVFLAIVERDLADGQHRNPEPVSRPEFFTTAYFHLPQELADEVTAAGFQSVDLYGIEGPSWIVPWSSASEQARADALFAAKCVEREPSLIGFSTHVMAVGMKAG